MSYFIEIIKYILIILGLLLGFSYLVSLIKIRLGIYIVNGSQQEILEKLYKLLKEQEYKKIKLNVEKQRITMFGLSKIIDFFVCGLDGNRVEFVIKSIEPHCTEIDIFGYCSFMTFFPSYSKKEWQHYGYNENIINGLIQQLI